ncbi:MAG: hypothetical protein GW789_15680, partial [Ignavibacteria bacterium]|nr:hypothetical protein [Ignavibacteria bacterium]
MNFRPFYSVLLFLICSSLNLTAQSPFDFPYTVKKYTVDDGLTTNSINHVIQDDLGFIWIATSGGLNRFDGHTFETIDLPIDSLTNSSDTYIASIQKYKSNLFFKTKSNWYLYDTFTQEFTRLPSENSSSERFYSLTEFSDSLIGKSELFKGKLSFINKKNWSSKPLMPDLVTNYFIHNDSLWTVSLEDVIIIAPDFSVKRIKHNFPDIEHVTSLFIKKKRNEKGFWVYNYSRIDQNSAGNSTHFLQAEFSNPSHFYQLEQSINEKLRSIDFYLFQEDAKQCLWINTEYDGLLIADLDKNILVNAKQIPSLKPYFEQFLSRGINEFEQQLWVYGNGTGLIQIDLKPKSFLIIPAQTTIGPITISTLTKRVWSLKNQLWFVNHNNPYSLNHIDLEKWKGESFQFTNENKKLLITDAYSLDNTNFFVGSIGNQLIDVNILTGKQTEIDVPFTIKIESYNSNQNHSGVASRSKNKSLWFGNRFQFFQLSKNHIAKYSFSITDSSGYGNYMWQMHSISDSLRNGVWFTMGGELGFHSFSTQQNEFITFKEVGKSDVKHIELIQRNDALNQNLWICTENGLLYFEPETGRSRYFDKRKGLPDNFTYGLLIDKNEHLWIPTNRGLARASIQIDTLGLPELTFKNYTVKDGLQSNEFNTFGYSEDDFGRFWLSGVGGINMFYPDSIKDDSSLPKPIIKQLLVSNKPIETDSVFSVKKHFTLSHENRDLTLEYTGIYFRRAEDVTYAYKLTGFDEDWIYSGKENRVRYTNLKPGLYKFSLKAANYDQVWSEPISIWITILTPFWLSWWFISLYVLALIGLIFAIVRYYSFLKVKQLLRELEKKELINKERSRIAQDLHDEIGANLTQIAMLSELVNQENSETSSGKISLSKVAEAAKSGVNNLSEIVWSLNPKHDNLEKVVSYIQEYTEN